MGIGNYFKKVKDIPPLAVTIGDMTINKTHDWRSIRPVVDPELCSGCMLCWKYCPDICIEISGKKPVINLDYCKGCGICSEECPKKAIEMTVEDK